MTTIVIGLGNADRGDDAVGLVVADALATHGVDVDIRRWEGADVDLLSLWKGYDRVVLIDALVSGATPGTIRRVVPEDLMAVQWPVQATHDFGLPAVIELARRLNTLPPALEIWTVEAAGTRLGEPLTKAVASAAQRLTTDLVAEFGG